MKTGTFGGKKIPTALLDYREGTSDEKAIAEVYGNQYQRPRLGFTIEPGDSWIDGGANIGAFAVFAGKLGAHVVAYEPEPMNAAIAQRNLTQNGLTDARVVRAAIIAEGQPETTLPFYVSTLPNKLWRHSLVIAHDGKLERKRIAVRAVPFDAVLKDGDCVKLDIEGAEIDVLQRLTAATAARIRKLTFEWSFDVDRRLATLRGVVDALEQYFPKVLSRGLPWDRETYDFFPPCTVVFAWRP